MSLEISLIIGFILHFVGDYLFQNDWLANEKTKAFFPAFFHAAIYSLPFLFLTPSVFWWILAVSHFFIDRYRLAVYWIKLVNWNWNSKNFGYDDQKPLFLSIWLMIIIDNVFHVLFNSLSIFLHFHFR